VRSAALRESNSAFGKASILDQTAELAIDSMVVVEA